MMSYWDGQTAAGKQLACTGFVVHQMSVFFLLLQKVLWKASSHFVGVACSLKWSHSWWNDHLCREETVECDAIKSLMCDRNVSHSDFTPTTSINHCYCFTTAAAGGSLEPRCSVVSVKNNFPTKCCCRVCKLLCWQTRKKCFICERTSWPPEKRNYVNSGTQRKCGFVRREIKGFRSMDVNQPRFLKLFQLAGSVLISPSPEPPLHLLRRASRLFT